MMDNRMSLKEQLLSRRATHEEQRRLEKARFNRRVAPEKPAQGGKVTPKQSVKR